MNKNELGQSGIWVSELCLGSMTWGTQNTEAEGHEQIDYASADAIAPLVCYQALCALLLEKGEGLNNRIRTDVAKLMHLDGVNA